MVEDDGLRMIRGQPVVFRTYARRPPSTAIYRRQEAGQNAMRVRSRELGNPPHGGKVLEVMDF
jgi:hypothetical protein